jgi:RNA polymerase sigma factor (sigma-70 family)
MYQNDYLHIDSLVAKVKENNTDALWELFDFYKPIINVCVNKVHSKYKTVEKDDLFSECIFIFKDLCMKYEKDKCYFSYYLDTRLQPYLVSKVKSKYIDKINIVTLNEHEHYDQEEFLGYFDGNPVLEKAINSLPEKTKHIIDLFYFKNLTQSECAVVLKISQPAFNKKLHKALEILRKNMEKEL